MPGSIEWTGRRFHQKQGSLMSTTAPPNIPRYVIYSKHFTVNLAIFKPDFTTDTDALSGSCISRFLLANTQWTCCSKDKDPRNFLSCRKKKILENELVGLSAEFWQYLHVAGSVNGAPDR